MMICEDAPCCGCCGTNLYGATEMGDGDREAYYCDLCGFYHGGPCPEDNLNGEEDEEEKDDTDTSDRDEAAWLEAQDRLDEEVDLIYDEPRVNDWGWD